MSENELVIAERPRILSLGALPTTGPIAVIQQASAIATELARIIRDRSLANTIQGRKFVRVEGWSTLGAMLGVLPREVVENTRRLEDGSYEATVELIRISDGMVIGRASAICGMDEKDRNGKPTWANRPEYARRSMAITRATGKAFRLGFSWIMALAGYEPTPAEEIEALEGQFEEIPAQPRKQAKAKAETTTLHWSKQDGPRRYFWGKAATMTLTNEQAYEALGVEHLEGYDGSVTEAVARLDEWVKERVDEKAEEENAKAEVPA